MISETKKIRFISLFSGCGGETLGFELCGINIDNPVEFIKSKEKPECLGKNAECVAYAEFWKPAIECHDYNFKNSKLIGTGDVTKITEEDLKEYIGNIDLISGGFPCQSFSIAGSRGGMEDPRGQLFKDFVKIVDIIKPKYVIGENVEGLLSYYYNNQNVADLICSSFRNIGYEMTYRVLCARDYGVSQVRNRIIFIGSRDVKKYKIRFPKPSHTEQCNKTFDGLITKKWITSGEMIDDIQELNNELNAHKEQKISEARLKLCKLLKINESMSKISDKKLKEIKLKKFNQYIKISNKFSPTLTKGNNFFHYSKQRFLTGHEYARLSSFPDWFFFPNEKKSNELVGNAIPPLMAKAIIEAIQPYMVNE